MWGSCRSARACRALRSRRFNRSHGAVEDPAKRRRHRDHGVRSGGRELGSTSVLVRATKLEHEREYQQDAAGNCRLRCRGRSSGLRSRPRPRPNLVVKGAAASVPAVRDPSGTACRRGVGDAIAEVVHRPQRDWVRETEWRPPGRPLRGRREVARALTTGWPASPHGDPSWLSSKRCPARSRATGARRQLTRSPTGLSSSRSLDGASSLHVSETSSVREVRRPTAVRGIAACERVVEALDDISSEPFFRQVGRLQEVPTANQVLLKREGYRQIFSTFALIESSLDLQLELDDAVHPSQRNVASLYEYWTFLKLVEVLGELCDDPHASLSLFEPDGDGLSLGLKRGRNQGYGGASRSPADTWRERLLQSHVPRDRRGGADGSWSRAMVPDASVLIRPEAGRTRVENERDLDVWLHFDAKYKLDWSSAQFERASSEREELKRPRARRSRSEQASSRRDDLLKMHAYRDAIRRSAGAYVLFPGTPDRLSSGSTLNSSRDWALPTATRQ